MPLNPGKKMTDIGAEDLWIFGYGSLMWNPGFPHEETVLAQLNGYHRSPCIHSWVHRGTRERPGIVLGLAPGGQCIGTAFKVSARHRQETLEYLRERELVTDVYLETSVGISLLDERGRVDVTSTTYVADTSHAQYAGVLDEQALLERIRGSVGRSGRNEDYIIDTASKLRDLGIDDPLMHRLHEALVQGAAQVGHY